MIGQDAITGWRRNVPWRSDLQVEQDLILHSMIHAIYSDEALASKLAMRGGTCLNKLVWAVPVRYSEDLDFVQTTAEKIGPTVDRFREIMSSIYEDEAEWESTKESFKLFYSFVPEGNPNGRQRIKVEINTREHFSVEGYAKRSLILDSLWRKGKTEVTTFSIEELFATKLRALYQRRKGRDLFDLWKSRELRPDYTKVVNIFLKYIRSADVHVHSELMSQNLKDKLKDRNFTEDVIPLLVPDTDYDPVTAADFVLSKLIALVPGSKGKKKKS